MDHEELRWIVATNDHSGRLIQLRIRLTRFDTEKIKSGKANKQADVLLRLNIMSRKISHDEIDKNTVFLGESTNFQLELNKAADEEDLIDVE